MKTMKSMVKDQLEYNALVMANVKKKGKLPRVLFVRGMMLENKLKNLFIKSKN